MAPEKEVTGINTLTTSSSPPIMAHSSASKNSWKCKRIPGHLMMPNTTITTTRKSMKQSKTRYSSMPTRMNRGSRKSMSLKANTSGKLKDAYRRRRTQSFSTICYPMGNLRYTHYQNINLQIPINFDYKIFEEEGKLDISKEPYFGFDPNKNAVFLRAIPVSFSRWDILEVVQNLPGFLNLSLSEPLKNQSFSRYAWVSFDSESACNNALVALSEVRIRDFQLSPIKSNSGKKNIKVLQLSDYSSFIRR